VEGVEGLHDSEEWVDIIGEGVWVESFSNGSGVSRVTRG
jgi:hypothetical protein